MPLEDVLVHTAWPILKKQRGNAVYGDTGGTGDETGTPFDCCLFLTQGSESPNPLGRQTRRPTLLFALTDSLGQPVGLSFNAELDIVAPELNVAAGLPADESVRWQVDGSPQPFGKPGEDVIGHQATVKRVEE